MIAVWHSSVMVCDCRFRSLVEGFSTCNTDCQGAFRTNANRHRSEDEPHLLRCQRVLIPCYLVRFSFRWAPKLHLGPIAMSTASRLDCQRVRLPGLLHRIGEGFINLSSQCRVSRRPQTRIPSTFIFLLNVCSFCSKSNPRRLHFTHAITTTIRSCLFLALDITFTPTSLSHLILPSDDLDLTLWHLYISLTT